MSFTVYHGAADITSYVIDYQRQKRICNGIGECTLTLSKSYATAVNPYNEIIIWENGVKKGTYFVAEATQTLPDYNIQIKAQDITKQLADYFISDIYEITYPSTSKYWIEKFLVEAGITYHFIGSEVGHQMSLNTWVGNENVYDLVQRLCMENGWYFLADEDNELEIGKLLIDYDAIVQSVQDDDITNLTYSKDDKMLRNRIIIRGNADYLTQIWVTGEVKIITPWNYDSNDYRTAVLMSPDVPDVGIANQLANQVLDETRKITEVKAIECAEFINAECGNTLYVQSEFWNGTGIITTFITKVSDGDGERTVAVLDERCPRLFGYYAGTGDVFIGTEGNGIWRKPLKFVHDWEDYSQGLQSLNVTDLSVANGVKSCIANGELYIRTPLNTQWIRQLPDITVSGIPSLGPYCMDSVVTRDNSTVEAIYADVLTVSGENRSFLVTHTVSGLFDIIPITVSGIENIYAYGMDHDGKDTYISVYEPITISGIGGTSWTEFDRLSTDWSWRNKGNSWGEVYDDNIRLVNSRLEGYTPPADYLDYETHWTDAYFPYPIALGISYENDLHAQWIVNNIGFKLRADSTFRITTQRFRGSDWNYALFFEFYFDDNEQPGASNFYVNFNAGTVWPIANGTIISESAIGYPRYTDTTGEHVFEFAFDPSLAGKVIRDFAWTSDVATIHGGGYVPQTVSTELTKIEFTNVDKEPGYENQGDSTEIPSNVWSLLKYDGTTFERKLWLSDWEKVEISQQSPIILFGGDPVFNSGALDIWYQKELDPTYIFASGYVSDARSAMLLTASGLSPIGFFCINPPSGSLTSDLMYTDFSNTLTSGITYGGWYIIDGHLFYSSEQHQYALANYHTFPGIVTHVETTNFSYDEPFILTSVTISGESNFYQKDGRRLDEPDTEFIARNNFLPSSKVTCIRMDDRI